MYDKQDDVAESKCGNCNAGGDQARAGLAEGVAHQVRGRRLARGESVVTEHGEVGEVRQQVARRDQQHAEEQRARQGAPRFADLAGDVVDVGPAAVREQHRQQHAAERERVEPRRRRGRFGRAADRESDGDP